MRIASWNVNSLRPRLGHLAEWLRTASPDVVCMQETKVEDAKFPIEPIEEMGYRSVFFGQKAYNGVAFALRFGLVADEVVRNLDGDDPDAPRRMIACTVDGIRIVNVYVPNGQAPGTDAFRYKLGWFDRLRRHLDEHHRPDEPLVVCGDFNVAPEPIDVHDPARWEGHVLFHPDERAALRRLCGFGLVDAFREKHADGGHYSWWDYRAGSFKKNQGLRIDLALMTRPLLERCTDVRIDPEPRAAERPSDHAPLVVEIDG